MNRTKLQQEGEKWVEQGIISERQLAEIVQSYQAKDHSYILILLAAFFISIGILIFAFSDWAQVPNFVKMIIMLIAMTSFYLFGDYYYKKRTNKLNKQATILGVSFILLGYIFFGATLFLMINMYHLVLFSVWPLLIWSIVGFLLYVIYEHRVLFVVGLIINVYSQFHNEFQFSSFSWILFVILLFGYFHYTFHKGDRLFHVLFAIAIPLQLLALVNAYQFDYYWYSFFILVFYLIGEILPKKPLRNTVKLISITAIFIYKMFETFFLQDEYLLEELANPSVFFILILVFLIGLFIFKWLRKERIELIDLILFIPLFTLPFGYLLVIISMFIFSLVWLIYSFQDVDNNKMLLGITAFIFSTLTAYTQFAWESLNKSLFFLIGGVLLFGLSFVLDKTRRLKRKGDE